MPAAISTSIARRKNRIQELEGNQVESKHALSVYWESWYARQITTTRDNLARWARYKRLLWEGTTGIWHQAWATLKSVEHINFQDFIRSLS